nr:hypothetical protein [Thermoproteota archaeon]
PDGKIYFGGYQIYTLDSIGQREQMLFPIKIDLPSGVDIGEISVNQEQKRILVDANVNSAVAPGATVTLQIPRSLLDNVTSVTIDGPQGPSGIEFDIKEFGPDYTIVSLNVGSHVPNAGGLKLTIY